MLRQFVFAAIVLLATPARAQDLGCPVDIYQQLHDQIVAARAGKLTVVDAGRISGDAVGQCRDDRVVRGQVVALLTAAGLNLEPPDQVRFRAHIQALRTARSISAKSVIAFDPVPLTDADGASIEWTNADERDAYWDLMFAMSGDFLVSGTHTDIYTPGSTERVGCGLYPAEEASALATHAVGNVDNGDLVARVYFLGANCDTPEHETSGAVAAYFEGHYHAKKDNPDYIGLTGGDIRGGLRRFLAQHLDGRDESPLFPAAAVAEYLAY